MNRELIGFGGMMSQEPSGNLVTYWCQGQSLPGGFLWSQRMLETQRGVKEGMGIRVRTGFVVYHFCQTFAAFLFLIHSVNTSRLSLYLCAWYSAGHLEFKGKYRRITAFTESGGNLKCWLTFHSHSYRRSSSENVMHCPIFL